MLPFHGGSDPLQQVWVLLARRRPTQATQRRTSAGPSGFRLVVVSEAFLGSSDIPVGSSEIPAGSSEILVSRHLI